MTILGAHVLEPDLAVCWADSELYDDADRGIGMVSKLVVNPAGFVFTMTGWEAVAAKAASCVARATSMRGVLQTLPWALRRASEQVAPVSRRPEMHGAQWAALIGWDRDAPGMYAYRLTAAECFVPLLDPEQTVPPGGKLRPDGPAYVEMIANQQLDRLRECGRRVRGGPLYAAVIRPDSITCNRICDLAEAEEGPADVH